MNPPYAFNRPWGGRHGVYSNGQIRDSTQGMAKIWKTIVQRSIKQGLYVLVKEAVVLKEFKSSKEDRT
jgi:hypothetical protein